MSSDLGSYFAGEWAFARSLTRDLLASLGDDDLLVVPTYGMAPLWKQFRQVERVQENYLRGLESGRVVFTPLDLPANRTYDRGANRDALLAHLDMLDDASERLPGY